ncbi:valine--pyruvate transaminase [Leptospira kobayashii]|uniref:Valine--pyruvate transaminase n=1 Tax=Leptospira kobayashii TaxID=1917830 RepID=A0ABM7URF5_9LEPT|nr:valine--pyruvate transaminase [Leptospira kobayashii]BDA77749.1 valine--pyruvate transaminase [Leptospira kobayashii]
MILSRIAKKLTRSNGIQSLMEDLGSAWSGDTENIAFLGGGNPARIPEAEAIYRKSVESILTSGQSLESLLGDYTSPVGSDEIRRLTAEYLGKFFGATLQGNQIAFFNGSQNAYSFLLNSFSGTMEDGSFRKILLPVVPEYIGYADQTWEEDVFFANLPIVENIGTHRFRYKLNQESIPWETIGCVALSRPTNPTGNIMNREDVEWLYRESRKNNIPLLIDLAYGNPFPNLIGEKEPIQWKPGMVLSLSFSKVGLPGVRLGIIIADPKIISVLSSFAAVGNLAVGNWGQALAKSFWKEDTLIRVSNHILRPYYANKLQIALEIIEEIFAKYKVQYAIHEPEGGFFLWIHFPDLPISNKELYQTCKKENVYIVSGHYFFPGLNAQFSHTEKCIRLTYCRDRKEIARGAEIIARIVSRTAK